MKRILLLCYSILFFTCSGESFPGFKTDTSKSLIDINSVLPGGPGKDGIPAINNPSFIDLVNGGIDDDELGIFVSIDGVSRFYPYNILVWHEIVNDSIGKNFFSVTFCPLCGSGIVFNREVDGKILTFGVSGYLYESNLLMYDSATESLWSQSRGEAVIGVYIGKKLGLVSASVLSFKQVKEFYPDTKILSTETGFSRNYNYYPYGNYGINRSLFFPTSEFSERFHPKEMMYAFRYMGRSYSFPVKTLERNNTYSEGKTNIEVKEINGVIEVYIGDNLTPGYYEMWFSWYIQNSENGTVIEF